MMIERLEELMQSKELATLLNEPGAWRTLDVDYFPPRVERLSVRLEDMILYLHVIHHTDEPCLFHKHRWPSAVYILEGSYEMGVTYSKDNISSEEAYGLPIAAKMVLRSGSMYEMTEPHAMHYVKPIGRYSLSIMITGDKYDEQIDEALDRKLDGLSDARKQEILDMFKKQLFVK